MVVTASVTRQPLPRRIRSPDEANNFGCPSVYQKYPADYPAATQGDSFRKPWLIPYRTLSEEPKTAFLHRSSLNGLMVQSPESLPGLSSSSSR